MALTRTQYIDPSISHDVLTKVFNNLPAFCFTAKVYRVHDGRKKSYSDYELASTVENVSSYYWMFYSKGHDRLYTLVYLNTGEYMYMKTKGVTGRYGESKKMRIYVSTNLEDLLRTALTKTEYNCYREKISYV